MNETNNAQSTPMQPTPLQPTSNPPQMMQSPAPAPKNHLVPILSILLVLALAAAGYFAYQNYQYRTYADPVVGDSQVLAPTFNPTNDPGPTMMPELTYEEAQLMEGGPNIVFTPPLDENEYDDQRTEIHTKIIEPIVDYYANPDAGEGLASINIEINTNPETMEQYPYVLNAEMKNGGEMGQTLSHTNGILDWWIPTCMGPCPYTPEFQAKYPQIVAQTN